MTHIPSREEIEYHRTPRGGFTKATLAMWGVPWPPPKGWLENLVNQYNNQPQELQMTYKSPIQFDHDEVVAIAQESTETVRQYGQLVLDYKNAQAIMDNRRAELEKFINGVREARIKNVQVQAGPTQNISISGKIASAVTEAHTIRAVK